MSAGKRELRSWQSWLAIATGMSFVGGIASYAVSAALRAGFHEAFPSTLWIGCSTPFTLTILAAWQERQAFRRTPKRETGNIAQVVIRDRANGRAIATVEGSSLQGASFVGVSLYSACLWGEDLSTAKFRGVNLQHAMLRAAILDGADLRGANLRGAELTNARFRDADLRGADLTNTFPRNADLSNALYDQHTRWPKGFDPTKHGCILVDGPPGLSIPASVGAPGETALPIPSQIPSTESPTLPRTSARASIEEAAVEARA